MEIALISAAAALASLLTFFTGFGLATIMTPVMLLFFPAPVAIAITAVVHFLNNLFKYALLRSHIDWRTVLRFGAPAGIGALMGAGLLWLLPQSAALLEYSAVGKIIHVTPLGLIIGTAMVFFALLESLPRLKNLKFSAGKIYLGGFLSGFFGGVSGHQGALRSAFLIRIGLGTETFIATGIAIACIVDAVRLAIYQPLSGKFIFSDHTQTITAATLSAFAGALLGNLLLKKVTIGLVQSAVAAGVIILGLSIATGVLPAG